MPIPRPRPLVTLILDGWGISFVTKGNAIKMAQTPTLDMFARYYPTAAIYAAGIEVGLPWGEVGNSETGHSNIGAGEIQYQSLPLITKAIEDKSFFANTALLQAIAHVKQYRSNLHLMGLVSSGGVHSHISHLIALLEMAAKERLHENVFIHMFTDGRDTSPQSALIYLHQLEEAIGKYNVGKIASVTGRFYAMDRNENWDRTKDTYNMLTGGSRVAGASTPEQAIQQSYDQRVYDEMIPPTAITRGGGPIAPISKNDAVIFFNYRPDRARQLTRAFTDDPPFVGFERTLPENLLLITLAQYDVNIHVPAAYVESAAPNPLAKVISDAGLTQLHMAETEKYAHVTYYLNGGNEIPFPGEEHVLIKSSSVKSFADEPEMAAELITNRLIEEIDKGLNDVYFVNFANADMVGHTGNFDATVRACTFVDACVAKVYEKVIAVGGAFLITADHGNAEEKIHPQTGEVETDHTSNPVPVYFVTQALQRSTPKSEEEITAIFSSPIGVLSDMAPTILDILQVPKPSTMTGISLLSSLQ